MPSLRMSEPVDSVIADLEIYIPEYMNEENIPGVAIALIRNGKMVWTQGFGVKNVITDEPVIPGTLFELASNSKLVTTYMALKLVDQGIISLDEPLNNYLPEPWLPSSEYRNSITLRHVLSHTSGLGHLTFNRENHFAPGRGYSYSNNGFLYLQAVVEQITGQSLEGAADELVFTPLGMSSSSYVNHARFISRTANGHVHAIVPILFFTVPYLIALVIISLVGFPLLRIWKGNWRIGRSLVFVTLSIAYGLVLLPIFIFLGKFGMLKFAWMVAFCGITMAVAFALVFVILRVIFLWLFTKQIKFQKTLIIFFSVLILVGLILLSSRMTNMPVLKWPSVYASAAWSLRATAGDMATFLIELSNPQYLSGEISNQLRSSQVSLSKDLSWGLIRPRNST